jgi:predicted translin family RNA/ssDNA-binding protein
MSVLPREKTAESKGVQPVQPNERGPKSGYARAKIKLDRAHQRIVALEGKLADLEADYVALERAFSELKELNASLAGC